MGKKKGKGKGTRKILPWWAPYKRNTCAACGEWAKDKRRVQWCCRSCYKMPVHKFDQACREMDRIKEAARREAKAGEVDRKTPSG